TAPPRPAAGVRAMRDDGVYGSWQLSLSSLPRPAPATCAGGRPHGRPCCHLRAVTPSALPIVALKSATHCSEQRCAHWGSTASSVIFLSSSRSAWLGSTSTILPLTG